MGKLIWIVIGLIVYFGGGWIAKDIVFSMIEVTGETTLRSLTSYEFTTYSVVAGLMSRIAANNEVGYISLYAIGITWVAVNVLPLSMGLGILYNIINVGGIIWAIYTRDNIE